MEEKAPESVFDKVIEDEMTKSYLDYSMSVIVGRALPDVRDGLKPVHRRVLYAMYDMGMLHGKPFKKSARIVGEVLGKYHPHGDSAVYETMVRMVQDFSLRYPLVQGQGNFGSVDGDSAAAMRYTEARLNKMAEETLEDIDKDTVDFTPNFDGSLKEPTVLPSKAPQLLINGSAGIAVGMATNIPPHNLNECCSAVIAMIENPEISLGELMTLLPGPDFPTGGSILGTSGIKEAYATGRGKMVVRAKVIVEEHKNRQRLIVNEIPYQVNKALLVEAIAELVRDKKILGISDLRDESDRDGMRIVIELKQGANSDVVQNQLFAHTNLQTTFGIIMIALVDNQPVLLPLKQIIQHFIDHRRVIVRRRTSFDLREAEKKAHVLEGLVIALDNIDKIIAFIKKSKSTEEARNGLVAGYGMTVIQAQAVLDMKLQRLTSLEQGKIREELEATRKLIGELKAILADENRILAIIKDELRMLEQKYGDERRTVIAADERYDIMDEELIKPEDNVVTITRAGYVKRLPVETYETQNRGGKGIIGTGTKDDDDVEDVFIANARSTLLIFTNKGKIHWLKVWQIPEAGRTARGTAIVNLLQLEDGEKPSSLVPVKTLELDDFNRTHYVFMCTAKGTVKRTALEVFCTPRKGGILAIDIEDGDELIGVRLTDGKRQLIIATENGMSIRFDENDVRPMGRAAAGVIGMRLREDRCVALVEADEKRTLLTVTERGFGKRTEILDYRMTSRGGVGIINLNITEKNGKVVVVRAVKEDDELLLISRNGIIIRLPVKQVSLIGRNTQGVRLMRLEDGDAVVSAARIVKND